MITRRGLLAGLASLPALRAIGPLADLLPTVAENPQTYGTGAGEVFSIETLEAAIRKCREMNPVIKPFVGPDGKSYYVITEPNRTRLIQVG